MLAFGILKFGCYLSGQSRRQLSGLGYRVGTESGKKSREDRVITADSEPLQFARIYKTGQGGLDACTKVTPINESCQC